MEVTAIQKRMAEIDKLQEEIKTAKEMLKDALESDPLYPEVSEEAKVVISRKKQILNEVYSQAANQKLVQEIKVNRDEITTLKEILSEELIEYRQQHKTETIQSQDGETRIFKFSVKFSNKNQSDHFSGN